MPVSALLSPALRALAQRSFPLDDVIATYAYELADAALTDLGLGSSGAANMHAVSRNISRQAQDARVTRRLAEVDTQLAPMCGESVRGSGTHAHDETGARAFVRSLHALVVDALANDGVPSTVVSEAGERLRRRLRRDVVHGGGEQQIEGNFVDDDEDDASPRTILTQIKQVQQRALQHNTSSS
ncbi:hypothetical protein RI054_14g69810 [Pseudoscourfieldia marina]